MNTQSESFILFRNRDNFLRGAVGMLDFSELVNRYNTSKTDDAADCKALRADWRAVGKDLYKAMDKYARSTR